MMLQLQQVLLFHIPGITYFCCLAADIVLFVVQDHTKVGSANSQDIQLCGMGIQAEHCVIDITTDVTVILTPHPNAR